MYEDGDWRVYDGIVAGKLQLEGIVSIAFMYADSAAISRSCTSSQLQCIADLENILCLTI